MGAYPDDELPSFLLLSQSKLIPFSSSHGQSLLGRLCESMHRPLQKYVPDNPAVDLANEAVEVLLECASVTVNTFKDTKVEATLKNILSVAHARTSDSEYNLESQWIRTITLPQQDVALEKVCQKIATHDKFLGRLKQKKHWYMVVSIMTCGSGKISSLSKSETQTSGSVTVPLQAALAGTPSPVPVADPGASFQHSGGQSTRVSGDIAKEMIFAVEYREVHGEKTFLGILKRIRDVEEVTFATDGPVPQPSHRAVMGSGGGGDYQDFDDHETKGLEPTPTKGSGSVSDSQDIGDPVEILKKHNIMYTKLDEVGVAITPPNFPGGGWETGVSKERRMRGMR